jgi:hypothetical protein
MDISFNLVLLSLAVLTSFACMIFLFRAYAQGGPKLLLWSALCFVGISLSNLLLFFDLIVFPTAVDLRVYRLLTALGGLLFLLYAFIFETE